jgi:hypothetical protein
MRKEILGVHRVWFKLRNHLTRKYYRMTKPFRAMGKLFGPSKELDYAKLVGYDAMQMLERYAKKNREVRLIDVDDGHFANSTLVLIPHETGKKWMGVSVIFIPQCCPNQNEFFLYPCCVDSLIKELRSIQKRQRAKGGYR